MIKKLAGHTFIYGIGSALSAAAGFLLIPLYTHVMTTSEYGVLELLNRTADVLMLMTFMGIRSAYARFYFDSDSLEWRKKTTGTTVIFVLGSSLLVAAILYPFKAAVSRIFFHDQVSEMLFTMMLIWMPMEMLVNVGLTFLQVRMKSLMYVGINFFKLVLFIASNIVLVYVYRQGVAGAYLTNIWVSGLIALIFLIFLVKWSRLSFSTEVLKGLVKFGLPYLPSSFFMYIMMNSDRYFLSIYSSLDAIGIYALASKIGMMGMLLIMEPIGKVWTPFVFDNYRKEDGPGLINRVFMIFLLLNVAAAIAVAVLSPIVIPFISDKAYHSSYSLVPLLCVASIFYSAACLVDIGILIAKKTHFKPFIFGVSSCVSVILNLFLIPRYGALGASITMVATFFTLFLVNYAVANRFFAIDLKNKKILVVSVSTVVTYALSFYILSLDGSVAHVKYLSAISLLAFPAILWGGGFFDEDEKTALKKLLARKT